MSVCERRQKKTGWKEDGVYLCERVCVCVSMCSTHKSTRGVTMVLPFCNRRLWSQCAAATNTIEVHRAYTRRLVSVHTTDWSRRPKRANRPLPRYALKYTVRTGVVVLVYAPCTSHRMFFWRRMSPVIHFTGVINARRKFSAISSSVMFVCCMRKTCPKSWGQIGSSNFRPLMGHLMWDSLPPSKLA